jgi:hypothetical protein
MAEVLTIAVRLQTISALFSCVYYILDDSETHYAPCVTDFIEIVCCFVPAKYDSKDCTYYETGF